MRKLRNLIGMPVISNGKRLGRLVQAELTQDLKSLSAIWVDTGLKGERCIPAEQLEMIGEMAVIADGKGQRKRCKGAFSVHRAISTGGQRLGAITGAEIDEISFLVQALELSGGLWDDFYHGRSSVSRYSVDEDSGSVIVQDPAEDDKEDET